MAVDRDGVLHRDFEQLPFAIGGDGNAALTLAREFTAIDVFATHPALPLRTKGWIFCSLSVFLGRTASCRLGSAICDRPQAPYLSTPNRSVAWGSRMAVEEPELPQSGLEISRMPLSSELDEREALIVAHFLPCIGANDWEAQRVEHLTDLCRHLPAASTE